MLAQCVTYASFGMPIAMLGAGWPEGRALYDRPTSAMGLLAMAYGLGRLATSASGRWVLRRWAIGPATRLLLVGLAGALVVVATSTSFPVLVAVVAIVGVVSGALDSLGHRYQATVRQVRQAGVVFGAYGVGATVGPALIALTSWRVAFLVAACISAAAAAVAGARTVAWPEGIARPEEVSRPAVEAHEGTGTPSVPVGVLVRSLLVFALYCTLEVAAGAWAAAYLEHRGAGARWAGLALGGFWAGMTLCRLALVRVRAEPRRILVGGSIGVAVAFGVVPLLPAHAAGVALVLAGFALAVMTPTLVATTSERVGTTAAGRVSGYQLLAANVAATGFTSGLGLVVGWVGDGAPGWALAAVALVALPVLLGSVTRRGATVAPAVEPGSIR